MYTTTQYTVLAHPFQIVPIDPVQIISVLLLINFILAVLGLQPFYPNKTVNCILYPVLLRYMHCGSWHVVMQKRKPPAKQAARPGFILVQIL